VASDWLGVSIAPDDDIFTVAPTWERLDIGVTGLRVNRIEIRRGRQSEWETTDTGTCTVTFNDRAGVLDPTNTGSPYYGKLISRPFAVALRDPVSDTWWPLFRGAVDDAGYGLVTSKAKLETAIVAVDAFDFFANYELVPGLAGFTNDSGFVEYAADDFQARLDAVAGDCGWPSALTSFFTGNINVEACVYSPGDTALQALLEAVDAEFPTIANLYVDRRGIVQAHGRYARFNPDYVSATASNWVFNRWKAGDNDACRADTTRAKMQAPFGFRLSRKAIRNVALAYPQTANRDDLASYVVEDTASRAEHGTRTWTAENLKVRNGSTTGNNAKQECMLYAQYVIDNYANPAPRVEQFTVGTEHPTHDVFGPAAWGLITGVDISDIVNIAITHPGGGGLDEIDHYVEGISYVITPGPGTLDDTYPLVKMTCDLSPASWWGSHVFFTAKAAAAATGMVGSGSDAATFNRAGRGSVGAVGGGADAVTATRAGRGSAGTTAKGTDAVTFTEAGAGSAGTVGSGASA
jgi:hypothetical protein